MTANGTNSPEEELKQLRFEIATERQLLEVYEQTVLEKSASETRFRELVEAAIDTLWEADSQGRFTYCSPSLRGLTGYEPRDLVGQLIPSVIAPEDAEKARKALAMVATSLQPGSFEGAAVARDGRRVAIDVRLVAILDTAGHCSGFRGIARDVSERKKAEDSLHLLRALLDQSSDAITVVDPETLQILDVNERACSGLGYTRQEFLSLRVPDFAPSIEDDSMRARMDMDIASSGSALFETMHRRKDGSTFPVEVSLRQVALDRIYNFAISRDISGRKKMEMALRASEARFRDLVESTSDWFWETDLEMRITYCSPRIRDHLGYTPEDAVGRRVLDFLVPEERSRVGEAMASLYADGLPHRSEANNIAKDGTIVAVEVAGIAFFDATGQLAGIRGTARNITGKKAAQDALRESEAKLQSVISVAPDAVILLDDKEHLVQWNAAAEHMFGYKAEEMAGLCFHEVLAPSRYREASRKGYARFLETGEGPAVGKTLELAALRRDGSEFPIELSLSALRLSGRWHAVGILRDITERRRTEEKILRLNEELEEKVKERTQQLVDAQDELVRKGKLAVLGQIAGSVGHELRNPLGVMSNAVYYLQTVLTDADDTTREYLGIIKDEITASERIVSDLLDSVRTKSPHPETVLLNELLNRTLGKCEIPSTVQVQLNLDKKPALLLVDPRQMQQVFRNLIMNGIEAMPQGGALQISAEELAQANKISIHFHDSGQGIAPENMSKLFQPLFTTKARGIGLGLVVVKNLIEANGGSVTVASAPGMGTTFTVELPCAEGPLAFVGERDAASRKSQHTRPEVA